MLVIKQTLPPPLQTKNKRLAAIPFAYAIILMGSALWQMVMFEKFVTAVSAYLQSDPHAGVTAIAITLISVEIFSIPFLLRLKLSPLARFCSASITFIGPFFWATVAIVGPSFSRGHLLAAIGFVMIGGVSFWLLNGPKAMQLRVKK